jgi:tripartite-type tricarboxylate transporter receptor subunit TctC
MKMRYASLIRAVRAGAVVLPALLASIGAIGPAAGQPRDVAASFPARPVRIFVQGGPGSPPDYRARLLAGKLAERWSQPVIVENRPGAGGQLALEQLLNAPPDGHALIFAGQGVFVIAPHVRKLPFDPVRDFAPITQVGITPVILVVNSGLPVRTVDELVAYAARRPGKVNAASPGIATTPHLAIEMLSRHAGVSFTHVPYKDGVGQTLVDLMSGKTDFTLDVFVNLAPFLKDGRLRALAVSGNSRLPVLPEVPTFRQSGHPEIESLFIWAGFFARAGTPAPIIAKVHRAITDVLQQPDIQATFVDSGSTVIGNTPAEFAAAIRAEHARYGKLIVESGVKLD